MPIRYYVLTLPAGQAVIISVWRAELCLHNGGGSGRAANCVSVKSCSFYEFDELGIRTSFLLNSHFALLNQEFYKYEGSKTSQFC